MRWVRVYADDPESQCVPWIYSNLMIENQPSVPAWAFVLGSMFGSKFTWIDRDFGLKIKSCRFFGLRWLTIWREVQE